MRKDAPAHAHRHVRKQSAKQTDLRSILEHTSACKIDNLREEHESSVSASAPKRCRADHRPSPRAAWRWASKSYHCRPSTLKQNHKHRSMKSFLSKIEIPARFQLFNMMPPPFLLLNRTRESCNLQRRVVALSKSVGCIESQDVNTCKSICSADTVSMSIEFGSVIGTIRIKRMLKSIWLLICIPHFQSLALQRDCCRDSLRTRLSWCNQIALCRRGTSLLSPRSPWSRSNLAPLAQARVDSRAPARAASGCRFRPADRGATRPRAGWRRSFRP